MVQEQDKNARVMPPEMMSRLVVPQVPKVPMNKPRFKIKQVEEALRKSAGIISAAAKILEAAGGSCTPQTVRNYIKRHPSLQTVIEETVELNLDLAESNLIAKIGNKNMTAIIFYLKTKGKHRGFVERNPRDRAARLSEGPRYPSQVPRCTTSCRNTSRSCPWHLGPTGAEIGQPVVRAVPHHDVGVFRPVPDALVEHRRDDAVRRPLQQLPGEAAASAVAHVEEFADPEMAHQPKLVVGKGVPPLVGRYRSPVRRYRAGKAARRDHAPGARSLRYEPNVRPRIARHSAIAPRRARHRRVVECPEPNTGGVDCPLMMVMSAGKIAEIKAGLAGNAVRDQAIGPGRGFAQEELGHFAQRCGFAAGRMPDAKTVIGGEPFR